MEVAYAEARRVDAVGGDFVAVVALGLEAAEFGGVFVEEARGLIAARGAMESWRFEWAVSGCMGSSGWAGWLGGEFAFEFAAAGEAPHGSEDFFDEATFEHAFAGEFGYCGILKVGVEGLFFGEDVVAGGVEAGGSGVLR